jgi:predicted dehydrogenase
VISQGLDQFVDYLIDAIGSGRVGFDDAVREFSAENPGEIASALKPFVQALSAAGKDSAQAGAVADVRRVELRAFAARLQTPEAYALAEALIKSQDEQISLMKTLEAQKRS